MKKFMPWLKAHWPIPVLLLVAILAAPTAFYFSRQMEESQVADFAAVVNEDWNKVDAKKATIAYYVPNTDGAGKLFEQVKPANEAMIMRYGEIWTEIQSKIGSVSESGLKFNQGEHTVLIDGLFPPPPDPVSQGIKGKEFVEKDIQFHQKLLKDIRAGMPPKTEDIAQQLGEYKAAFEAKFKAETGRDPGPEEQAKLLEELTAMRIGAVRKRAGEIGVYADVSIFEGLPTAVPEKAPSPSQAWDMQERAWIDQDICHAVGLANGASSGGVSDSVVKRMLRIAQPNWDIQQDQPSPQGFEAGDDKPPLNFAGSLTGRSSGPGSRNKWYDVRFATVEVIVSSQRLPQFLNALSATNFMTITDLDLNRVEPLMDLKEGFDYGEEHVVRARIQLETIWLREWRKNFIPPVVQQALAMDEKVQGTPGGLVSGIPAAPARGRGAVPGNKPPAAGGGGGRRGAGDERD